MTIKLNPKKVAVVIRREDRSLCKYPELDGALGSFVHSGLFIRIYQIQKIFNSHVNFCLVVLRIYLVTIFGPGIGKLQNGEDETSLPLIVKKLFDHVRRWN